jgi:metallo-beta-lactamase family protein
MSFELQFLGGAGTVTGSKYLLTYKDQKVLIDCGLFQGLKSLRLKNWEPFPIDPSEIDAVILTHAHIDHSGYIPRLINEGFKGKIYTTPATRDLCRILLADCGYLQEEEAEYLNRSKHTKHEPALPLFTIHDAERAMQYFEIVPFGTHKRLHDHLGFQFQYVGHILGAASVIINIGDRKIAFTGDVGRMQDDIFYEPKSLPEIDYLVTESTYGNRLHSKINILDEIEKIIHEAYSEKGAILVPAFAIGRAMSIMHYLSILKKQNRIPAFPMYLNSPMATDFSDIFFRYKDLHKLSKEECRDITSSFKYVRSSEESIGLNHRKGPMLIISASGMMAGGRILHHLKAFASDPTTTIIITGFQAAGTRGEALDNGASEIKIHGQYVPIKARVRKLDMSAHADYAELIQWFTQSKIKPKKVFITHGEPSAADELRRRLEETFDWKCIVPTDSLKVSLD